MIGRPDNDTMELTKIESDIRFCSTEISVLYDISSTRAFEFDKRLEKITRRVKEMRNTKGEKFREILVDVKKELAGLVSQLSPAIK